jgi:hypothetical protein
MKLIRILAAVALLIALPGLHAPRTHAQGTDSPEALAAAKELFAILSKDMTNEITNSMTAQLWPLIERDLGAKSIDQATRAELRKEFARIQLEHMSFILVDVPPIYARHFTAAELKELTAFYGTPIGQKALKVLPLVTGEFMQALVPRLEEVQRKTQQGFERVLREKGYLK